MAHAVPSHAEHISIATKGFILLLIITLAEVGIALIGNGHIISGFHFPKVIMIPLMIFLSLYKAYYIVSEFMHLGHETRAMAASVILPTLLLVWAIIAFLWEGDAWRASRKNVDDKNKLPATSTPATKQEGFNLKKASELNHNITLS